MKANRLVVIDRESGRIEDVRLYVDRQEPGTVFYPSEHGEAFVHSHVIHLYIDSKTDLLNVMELARLAAVKSIGNEFGLINVLHEGN